MLFTSYIEYFENLAVSHHSIQHVKASVNGDAAAGSLRFACYNVDDVISKSLRTKVAFPAMLLELYEWELRGSDVYDPKTRYTGAFTIIDHASRGDARDEQRAFAATEIIIWDMMQKIFTDHYGAGAIAVSYTHLTLPTNREV